jgi:alpha-glucosidase
MDNELPLASAIPGGTTPTYDAYISTEPGHLRFMLPMYVRSGAIIPAIPVELCVSELHTRGLERPITLNIYPGPSGAHDLYLDDGVSRSSAISRPPEQGGDPVAGDEYRHVRVTHEMDADQRKRVIRIQRLHDGFTPRESYFIIGVLHDPGEFVGEERPQDGSLSSVGIGDTTLPSLNRVTAVRRASELASSDANAWYYDDATNLSYIKVFDIDADIVVMLDYRAPTG